MIQKTKEFISKPWVITFVVPIVFLILTMILLNILALTLSIGAPKIVIFLLLALTLVSIVPLFYSLVGMCMRIYKLCNLEGSLSRFFQWYKNWFDSK